MSGWNGEPCKTEPVYIKVLPSTSGKDDFFKWWQPYVGRIMEALKVTQHGQSFIIYDGDNSATNKVAHGGGPNMGHKGFDNYEVLEDGVYEITKFKECKNHEWSTDTKPIFQTVTKYCIKCHASEFLENALLSMRTVNKCHPQ